MDERVTKRVMPETMEQAHEWIVNPQDSLHREREYSKKIEHDAATLRDAVWTVLCQTGLFKTTVRRILRLALQSCKFDGYEDICKKHGLRFFSDGASR